MINGKYNNIKEFLAINSQKNSFTIFPKNHYIKLEFRHNFLGKCQF